MLIQGEVPPDTFIPVAEATGIITQLGEWVMRSACRQLKEWQSAGLPSMRVGVNLSRVQFRRTDLASTIKRVLKDTDLDAQWLEIEITEGMIMDHVGTFMDTLHSIRNLGVDLAIDDFGTGYSSLAYLQNFPINRLKIDRSFVSDICSNPGNAAITNAIITLAHDLGMKVIAEGVETEYQFHHLKMEACDEAQGFHFTHPLTATEMTKWLAETGGCFEMT